MNKPIKDFQGIFQCQNNKCRANFQPLLKLNNDEYPNIPKNVSKKGLPLFWEMYPNPIESSYLNWIEKEENINGFHIITWPFNNVKFIPLFLLKYLIKKDPEKPIIIFSKKNRKGDPFDGVKYPAHNILFKSLCATINNNYCDLPDKYKQKLFEQIDKILKPKRVHLVEYLLDGEKKILHSPKKVKPEDLPEEAEIVFRAEVGYRGKTRHNKEWMSFIIANFNNIYVEPRENILEIFNISDFPDEKVDGRKIIFINPNMDTIPQSTLLDEKIASPRIVLIDNLDYYLHIFRRDKFYSFLNELDEECIVLLFSSTPRLRYLHNDFIEKFDHKLHFHCWDTKSRIEWITNNWDKNFKFNYFNPGSSKIDELRGGVISG